MDSGVYNGFSILLPILVSLLGLGGAGVAQLVEHLICNQRVGGSIPSASSARIALWREAERILAVNLNGLVSFDTSPFLRSIAFPAGAAGSVWHESATNRILARLELSDDFAG